LPKAGVWVFYSRTFSIRDDSDWGINWWVSWGAGTANDVLYVDSIALNKGNQIYNTTRSSVSTTGNVSRWGNFYNLGGNVGIGTTSPGATLDVNGSIYVSGEVSGRTFPFNTTIGAGADATTTTIRAGSTSGFQSAIFLEGGNVSNTIKFNTASAERMRITSGGNVGIGTTSITTSRLRVEGATSEGQSIVDFVSNDTTASATYHRGIRVLAPTLPVGDKILMSVGVADSTRNMGQLYFNYAGNGSTSNFLSLGLFAVDEVLNITGAGNVGIGTTSPARKLQVEVGSTAQGGQNWSHSNGTVFARLGIVNPGVDNSTEFGAASNNDLVLLTVNTERMRITSGGNVGIGLTNPQYRLHVTNSDGLEGTIALGNSLFPGLIFSNASTGEFRIDNRSSNIGYISFYPNGQTTIGNERMRITAAGTVQPGANGTQDLGTSSLRWATVFTSDLSLSNGIGDYTIVEGENDLFLYNNKQNKVYKFVIEEVDPSTATPKKS
jgi:hypothetical protein